jgi:diguanylate cyclase (GGDEF)-like protein
MGPEATSWSTQQLAEFVAGVSAYDDEASTAAGAVERAAEALEAEVGALVTAGDVLASVGFPQGKVPTEDLVAATRGGPGVLSLSFGTLGAATAAVASVEDAEGAWLVVARLDQAPFAPEEIILLRAMARVLSLRLRTQRAFEAERGLRQESETARALLEKTSAIQRLILRRAPIDEVLDAITSAAGELLGDEVVTLRMLDADDPGATRTVSTSGLDPQSASAVAKGSLGLGAGGVAIRENRLVVLEDYQQHEAKQPAMVALGVTASMSAPVHEDGRAVGSLTVATQRDGRRYTEAEREMLVAFAGQAGLALMDAKTVDAMMHQALHDPLTGLPNRTLFLDRLEHALARAERSGLGVAVCFIDLDEFKTVNDSLGHAAGDELLVAVAERMQRCARAADTAARLGGDEFALLLEDVDDVGAAVAVASRIAEELRPPFLVQGREILVKGSIGIASGKRAGDDVLRNADVAMYLAKGAGTGGYEVFQADMRAASLERLELQIELRRALAQKEFILHYQPIYDLANGTVAAVEALVRWGHPTRGLIPPGSFIPLAEETGLIVDIGRSVLRAACNEAASWPPCKAGEIAITVNVSARQLQDPNLVRDVTEALAISGLPASRLVLEITETVLAPGSDETMRVLTSLKGLGVGLALDDFGTGYSSLRYLHEFPLDLIKIAKPFVDPIGEGGESALAKAIVDLGRIFRLVVVAEGIERPEQLEGLRAMSAQLGQGYLLSRPVPAAELRKLLGQRVLGRASRRAA